MPLVAIDLGCHTARACTEDGRTAALRSHVVRDGAVVQVLERGVVVNEPAATRLVGTLLRRVRRFPLGGWRAVICAPGCATTRERDALVRAVAGAGVRVVAVVPETLAAAIGGGADVGAAWSQMVVDVGHGVTDAGVIRAGRLVAAAAPGPGCAEVQQAIARALTRRSDAPVAADVVERLCRELPRLRADPHGTLASSAPQLLPRDGGEQRARVIADAALGAAGGVAGRIATDVARFVRQLPPQAGCEVIESGILLSGGGALLDGLATRIAEATGIRVRVASRPLPAVLDGARDVLVATRALGLRAACPDARDARTWP